MGGLRRYLPRTRLAFLVGALALAGMPPLSGFWSKDSILASALADGWYGQILLVAGLAGVFLTGLYTFRMFFLVFEGDVSPYAREHAHTPEHGEGPFSMVSTVCGARRAGGVGGLIQIPGAWHLLTDWLEPGRAAARRAERAAGLRDQRRLGGARPRRDRRSPGRSTARIGVRDSEGRLLPPPVRAQVLLRRGLRLGLLPAGRLRSPAAGRASSSGR